MTIKNIGQIGGRTSKSALNNAKKMFGKKYKNISVKKSLGVKTVLNSWGVLGEQR